MPCSSTEIEDLEEEECSFVAELAAVYVPFDESGEEESALPSWKLERVPEGLKRELEAFTKHRTDPLVRAREGTACVDITVGNDKATALRFFGWLAATHSITPGLGVFCRPTLSQWAEEWLRALRGKGCRFSTLASESLPNQRKTLARTTRPLRHTPPPLSCRLRKLPCDGRLVCLLHVQAGRRDDWDANFPTRRDTSSEVPV